MRVGPSSRSSKRPTWWRCSRRTCAGDAAINNLIDATSECGLFEATVGFLVAAFGQEQVAAVLNEWRRRHQ